MLVDSLTTNYLFSKTERKIAALTLFIFALGCFIVGFFNPVKESFFPACPLLAATGVACPGCGLTRGFHALFHGDIWTSLSFNALVPIYAIIFLYGIIYLLSIVIRGRGLKINLFTPIPLFIFLGLCLVFGILRNIPIEPLTFFYP